MNKATETHRKTAAITDKMPPAALAAYRKRLKQQWEHREVDEDLLERAWHTAHEVATLLYEQFGATQVAVFGSLTEPMWFTKRSDIDIAVSGLASDVYDKARVKIMNLDSEFKIDIINFDTSKGLFRERVKHQAMLIGKGSKPVLWQTLYKHLQKHVFPTETGKIYEMNRKRLTQRINDELSKIDETLERIRRGSEKIEKVPIDIREFIENTIATDLADVYSGIENIFLRIAREVDRHVPTGRRWHKDLLSQMAEHQPERPPVISEKTFRQLETLLDFRHKVNKIYGKELGYEKTEAHAKAIDELFATLSEELDTFTDSLETQEEDA